MVPDGPETVPVGFVPQLVAVAIGSDVTTAEKGKGMVYKYLDWGS